MPLESNQTALAALALKRLARIFDYSRQESEAEDNWETLNPADRVILDQVFEAAWAVIQAHDPFRDLDQDEQLKFALREQLFVLAADGERDRQGLRSLLLADVLGRARNHGCLKLNLVKVRASLRCLASCRTLLIQLNRRR